jgi:DNA-binding response OmpR family regulator
LLIDDKTPETFDLMKELGANGYASVLASSEREAFEILASSTPSIIVLCAELPNSSGYSICSKIRNDEDLCQIPLVLTSLNATRKDINIHKTLKTRADAYIIKPFTATVLIAKIKHLPAPKTTTH